MESEQQEQCYVFIDNSNIWIEGQRAQRKGLKLKDAKTDPRFRINFRGFLDEVLKKRHLVKACLYGSEPLPYEAPSNEAVWEVARQNNIDTFIFSPGKRYEKEVDVAMAHGITKTLYQDVVGNENKEKVVFIIATGDRDFMVPIKDILKNKIRVELWSWENAMAKEYRTLEKSKELFTTNPLSTSSSIGYIEYRSTREAHSIVCKNITKQYKKELIPHIEKLKRLFFTTIHEVGEMQHLVVEFPMADPKIVLKDLEKLNEIKNDICSYKDYMAAHTDRDSETSTDREDSETPTDGDSELPEDSEPPDSELPTDREDSEPPDSELPTDREDSEPPDSELSTDREDSEPPTDTPQSGESIIPKEEEEVSRKRKHDEGGTWSTPKRQREKSPPPTTLDLHQ